MVLTLFQVVSLSSFKGLSSSVSETFPLGKRVMGFRVADILVFLLDEVVVDE